MNIIWKYVLDGLNELSSIELQQKLWIDGTVEISSFTEAICSVYDDSNLALVIDRGELDKNLVTRFKELDSIIDRIPENSDPKDIIGHPCMVDLRSYCKDLLEYISRNRLVE